MIDPGRPDSSEYAPYFGRYVEQVPDGDITTTLAAQLERTQRLLAGVSDAAAAYRPAPEEWSVKQIVGHLSDVERTFAHRAFCFARADTGALPGMEQDDYVRAGNYDSRTLADLLEEWVLLRRASIALFRSLDAAAWTRQGTASENRISVRALAYCLAGHENGHIRDIETKYLPQAAASV
jgi:hypothetical protein